MPSVSVLPSSPAHRTFGAGTPPKLPDTDGSRPGPSPSHQNGATPTPPTTHGNDDAELTVAEIKDKVRNAVKEIRGASAISLLRTAGDRAAAGAAYEAVGDLRAAYRALFSSAQITQVIMDHPEFKQEANGKKGVVWNEWSEFQMRYGNEVLKKAKSLETRLLEMDKDKARVASASADGDRKVGGSIADRIRSLQDTGLNVQTTKRLSRDLSSTVGAGGAGATAAVTSPTTPSSSTITRTASSQHHNGSPSISHSSSIASHATGSSIHSLASPSSFGPPSPSVSSHHESSHLSNFSLSEFNQTFPSIDELDENMGVALPQLPSVPTNKPGTAANFPPPASPSVIQRFPSLPLDLDPGPRPASTPIPPTMNVLQSRPPSPTRAAAHQRSSPLSPTIPPKPVSLTMTGSSSSTRNSPSRSSPMHTGDSSSRSKGIELPVTNTIFPKVLHEYLGRGNDVKVLLLDVRTRDEFAKGHIRSDAVVCLEPHVLLRDGLTSEKLEDALVVAPQHESAVFRNRDKFDLVVMYDWDSESFGASVAPLATAVRIIYETAFQRSLKRPPVILVGGLKAWVATFPSEVARDEAIASVELDMERMKLSSPTTNGSSYTSYVFKERSDSQSPEMRSPTTTGYSRNNPFVMNQIPENSSASTEANGVSLPEPSRRRVRKPAISRPPSQPSISFSPYINGAHAASASASSPSISYPQFPRTSSNFGTSLPANANQAGIVSPPPTASINPSFSRRRSDYIDQSEQAVSTFASRPSIDYPDLSAQHVVRPPPVAATPPSERQDQRRASAHGARQSLATLDGPRPPTINSEYPVSYWLDSSLMTAGLKNLGNTCYMNSTIQCLSATVPFARFFIDGRWKSAVNFLNPLGTKGHLTAAFASILHDLWHQESPTITPLAFRKSVCMYGQQFAGSEQHDSQEFLNFLLDGLHEDLNRILNKEPVLRTPEREAELELLPQQIASQQEWNLYRMRDDSIVVDFFQGQFRNRMECLTCRKTSTTYNSFMYLTLPIPMGGRGFGGKATLQQCLDAFVQEEVMEKADAWQCPNCKTLRKATKKLSISRLPPVLLIHLKRFTTKGHFTDKLETFVDFPLRGLDLTNYMPAPLPPNVDRSKLYSSATGMLNGSAQVAGTTQTPISLDDPRSQVPPYKYDLYAVTNHFGTLSSGHYTAFVNSRGNWLYCDDSRISTADAKEVVGKPAYVLYYKRVKG
ncbi:cysteine proteinase [Fomitiporia mediterranea MF3/22]|uniref:cysteine proteinase n=1 Tax=Fomitiporia mediterranea (strain MF3/22) TaxID=694068 RepID=UPI000440977A|nr:cysteine proteinase [Fomitiporia mediterranea MF3/22]EJC99956.1 cysteine proteinase [Fomitiporia mediterranea MF3/22]